MRDRRPVTLSLLVAVVSACGNAVDRMSTPPAVVPTAAAPDSPDPIGPTPSCTAELPGVEVSVADAADGAALTFVAPAETVEELQARVHRMWARQPRWLDALPESAAAGGAPSTKRGPIPITIDLQDLRDGARLVYRPIRPAEVKQVQRRVRSQASLLDEGECPAPG